MELKIKQILIKYIPYLIMLLAIMFMWNSLQKTKTELESYKRNQNKIETKDELNKPTDEVKERDKTVYPKIDREIEILNKDIKQLDKELTKLEKNKPTKEKSYEKFNNKSFEEINMYWNNITPSTPSTRRRDN